MRHIKQKGGKANQLTMSHVKLIFITWLGKYTGVVLTLGLVAWLHQVLPGSLRCGFGLTLLHGTCGLVCSTLPVLAQPAGVKRGAWRAGVHPVGPRRRGHRHP